MAIEGRTHKPVVDHHLCGTCTICYDACPAAVVPEIRQETDTLRGRAYRGYTPGPASSRQPAQRMPSCQSRCPLHQDVRGYIELIGQRRYQEALRLIRASNPLPSLCGYVCPHPCESACTRGRLDEALAIRALKQFVATHCQNDLPAPLQLPESNDKKVVIVGSGPAGLCAAHELAINGFAVEILEAAPHPGGMPAQVIPSFRLPPRALQHDIRMLETMEITIKTGVCFGRDITLAEIWQSGADAVILAVGTHKSTPLDIEPPKTIPGYLDCLTFLKTSRQPDIIDIGKKVIVVGGGNAAIDSARTALRLGAEKVTILYRRRREDMPAADEEIELAAAEGVSFHCQAIPRQLLIKNNQVVGLECQEIELSSILAGGTPQPVADSAFTLTADAVIAAVGQQLDAGIANQHQPFAITPDRHLFIDEQNRQTNIIGVFAAGDAVTGPSSVVEAMADGRKTALAVVSFLSNQKKSSL